MPSIITLTTDFGLAGPYVGAMKGVILSINPSAKLIDISHSIAPQNIRQAAMILAGATLWFPAGTIHVAVVDPGVGTERRIVYAEIGDQRYVCPDNGLLSKLAAKVPPTRIATVANAEHWRPTVSATFHGRDIMAPVAAMLSLGLDPKLLGPPQPELVPLDWPRPKISERQIIGEVIWIDDFGNLITNITADMLAPFAGRSDITIEIRNQTIHGLSRAYADHRARSLLALIGSTGHLEIASAGSSAAKFLAATPDTPITVRATP